MNGNKLKAALKKFTKESTIDEIVSGGYDETEANDIYSALQLGKTGGIDLSSIDYQNLTGKAFSDYLDILDPLPLHEKYDFEEWLATSEMKFRINENTGDKEQYLAGIKLNGNKRIALTRITLRDAIELNKHVNHLNTAESRGTSKYYLMAKEQR